MSQDQDFLRAKIQIGSCKNPVTYGSKQVVFHQDEVPIAKRERANTVRDFKASKILSTDKLEWDKHNPASMGRPVCERKFLTNFVKDRSNPMAYNYRAENMWPHIPEPVDKPTKFHVSTMTEKQAKEIIQRQNSDPVYRGYHCRTKERYSHESLKDKEPWQQGTMSDNRLNTARSSEFFAKARRNSLHKTTAVSDYISPMARSSKLANDVRKAKEAGPYNPKKSKLVHGEEEEKVDRKALVNRFANEPSRKYKVNRHSGVWEYSRMENAYMWSDTGSYDYNSKGDSETTYNPDAFNLAGPTLPATRSHRGHKDKRINVVEDASGSGGTVRAKGAFETMDHTGL
jgi:hypothetical protein